MSKSGAVMVTLPDGSTRTYDRGVTPADVASSIGRGLAKAAIAAKVDGVWTDLDRPVDHDAAVAIVTAATPDGRDVLRHSTAHVMAQAVTDLFPGAKYAIGPAIEDGFYYDFELPGGAHFSDNDLERIEARMREIVKDDEPFVREEVSRDAAATIFAGQPYKREIIDRVDAGDSSEVDQGVVISLYRNPRPDGSEFVDLCRGPHVPSTGRLGAFKLTKVAGAYWRGDEKRPMIQRIYGTAWESPQALAEHLHRLEEAEKRDHRRLGVELDLFSFPEEIGSGLAVFHPKGALVRKLMEDYSRARHEAAGYSFVNSPHISKEHLFQTSGHLDWFADGMFPPMTLDEGSGEGTTYYLKPMNCPFHILIFKSRLRSYRELPLRFFEFGTVYRYEKSGVVHGLTRVRGMTQDDAHIFCTKEQMHDELRSLLDFVLDLLHDYGLTDFYLELSTRPEGKAVGTDEEWDEATEALRSAALSKDLELVMDEGGGAFYGPKISVQARDAIGRTWQVSTIQLDFQEPQRFEMEYVGADNERHRPIMIHRALFGSIERFFAILVEHYAGAFPAWLAPVQVTVLPVADRHDGAAQALVDRLRAEGFRAELVDARADTLGARVRRAKLEKVPYVLVLGDDDVANATVGVNARGSDQPERGVPVDEFVSRLAGEVENAGQRVTPAGGLGRLWAGWRSEYIDEISTRRPADNGEECLFCALAKTDPESGRVVARRERAFVVMNAYPYTSGHVMVAPFADEGSLAALSRADAAAVMALTQDACAALQSAYAPDGINVGANIGRAAGAGVPGHVHVHVLPRWIGDTNFMTAVAETRVLPEPLSVSYEKLQRAWPA